MAVLDYAAGVNASLCVRFATLMRPLAQQAIAALCERLRVPNDCRELDVMCAREHEQVDNALSMDSAALVQLFVRCDAFRKPERFGHLVEALACDQMGAPFAPGPLLQRALAAARAVDAGAIAAACGDDRAGIPGAVYAARVNAVAVVMQT